MGNVVINVTILVANFTIYATNHTTHEYQYATLYNSVFKTEMFAISRHVYQLWNTPLYQT